MTKFDPAQCLADLLTSDSPSAETINWLRAGFARHLDGDSFAACFGPSLKDAYRRHQWRTYLDNAIEVLDIAGVSTRSIALELSKEFDRQRRTYRRPIEKMATQIRAALDVYPAAATTTDALWHEVRRYRNSK